MILPNFKEIMTEINRIEINNCSMLQTKQNKRCIKLYILEKNTKSETQKDKLQLECNVNRLNKQFAEETVLQGMS